MRERLIEYIALLELMFAQVLKSPGRAFTEFGFLSFDCDAVRTMVLRAQSLANGFAVKKTAGRPAMSNEAIDYA